MALKNLGLAASDVKHFVTKADLSAAVAFVGQNYLFAASSTLTAAHVGSAKAVRVRVVGGGGAGGGAALTAAGQSSGGGGGQGGHYAESLIAVSSLTFPVTVTVGLGGTGVSGGNGFDGDTSYFGSYMMAGGGAGGSAAAAAATVGVGAQGGLAASHSLQGDLEVAGTDGAVGWRFTATQFAPGAGGGSVLGGGVSPLGFAGNLQGLAGRLYGGGGAGSSRGASAAALLGGAGARGVVIVELIF